jgi:uncharacterized protein (DUF58 family)
MMNRREAAKLAERVKRLQFVSTRLVENFFAGNYRSVFRGQGIEFDEVREYVYGDDARLIDWNVSSRLGSPYTKVFRDERELVLFLLVDMSASLWSGSGTTSRREVANILVALLSFAAVANGDQVGAALFTDRIERWLPPMKGKRHVLSLIQDIFTLSPEGKGSDIRLALRTTHESLKRRGVCVVISDFKTDGYWKEMSLLSHKHDVIALKIADPLDYEFPETGLVQFRDPETGERIYGRGSAAFRSHYQEFWEHHRRDWIRQCRRRRVDPLEVTTTDDPAARLLQFFKRRKGG